MKTVFSWFLPSDVSNMVRKSPRYIFVSSSAHRRIHMGKNWVTNPFTKRPQSSLDPMESKGLSAEAKLMEYFTKHTSRITRDSRPRTM